MTPPETSARFTLLAVSIGILAVAPGLSAQSVSVVNAPRVELWGSLSAALNGPSGSLVSSYAPPALSFPVSPPSINTATQGLTFDSSTGAGFEAGVNVFLSRHAGIQVFADRVSMDMSGPSSLYERTLQYQQPTELGPFPPTRTVTIRQSFSLPATTGSLTQWVTAANGVVRLGPSGRVSATLSGGLSYYRTNGRLQPLGYTIYGPGPTRNFALFSLAQADYQLTLALEPTNALGFNAGGDVSVSLHKNLAVVVGYRYLGGPASDLPTHLESVYSEIQQKTIPVAEFQGGSPALPPARVVSVSGSRMLIGLKWMR
jgi:hypothetical protein